MTYYVTLALTTDIKLIAVFHRGLDTAMNWMQAHNKSIIDAHIVKIPRERYVQGILSTICMN